MNYMFLPLKRYADFNGRSRRKEFWSWMLLNAIVVGILMGIMLVIIFSAAASYSARRYSSYGYGSYRSAEGTFEAIFAGTSTLILFGLLMLWALATFIPSLAVSIRRLHDTNRSGWFYLMNFIPLVGPIILLVFYFSEGTPGHNQYGPDPKYGPPLPYGGQHGGFPPQHGGYPPAQGYPPQHGGYPPPPYGGHPGPHPGSPPYPGPQGGQGPYGGHYS